MDFVWCMDSINDNPEFAFLTTKISGDTIIKAP